MYFLNNSPIFHILNQKFEKYSRVQKSIQQTEKYIFASSKITRVQINYKNIHFKKPNFLTYSLPSIVGPTFRRRECSKAPPSWRMERGVAFVSYRLS
jgi:hypothetical protein